MKARAAADQWLTHLAVERQLSERTCTLYQSGIAAFFDAAQGRAEQSIAAISTDDIRTWLAMQHRDGRAASSLHRRLSILRGLFGYVQRMNWRTDDPTVGIKAPKQARKLPHILDPDEAKQLVEIDINSKYGLRDRVMLELFYGSGLRRGEMRLLTWGAVDINDGMVRVVGKGNKTRMVPLSRHACHALQTYRDSLTNAPESDTLIFPGKQGQLLSGSTLNQRLKKRAQEQGIWKNVHPHLLRHSFASHVLESSGNLRAVQEMLGHANIATTQIYTHLDFQHLAKVVDDAHPRSRREKKS